MLRFIPHLIMCILFSVLASFVLVNFLTGCEDWSKDNCTAPKQIWQEIFIDVD